MQPERFRSIRKAADLNQSELEDFLGLTVGYVSKMEKGHKPIERRTAIAMLALEALGIEAIETAFGERACE